MQVAPVTFFERRIEMNLQYERTESKFVLAFDFGGTKFVVATASPSGTVLMKGKPRPVSSQTDRTCSMRLSVQGLK